MDEVLRRLPLIAILRGVAPGEVVGVGEALADTGFLCLEVPLNSPSPLQSISALRARFGDRLVIGAGTVLTAAAVAEVAAAGAELAISPNADPRVIRAAKAAGLASLPAFLTPTEAFAAIEAGADALKLFPAEVAGPAGLKAVKAVLPPDVPILPVGGIEPASLAGLAASGAAGFGVGGALYRPGQSLAETRRRAIAFVDAWTALGGDAP
ncbi:MAG: 2-dehydro-3-deoxy-6-phosphogalactonate aldolase [Caulobacteraceae bacterium]|nr:2-dehydro-3-deoxy-6-phosphogalactonate aldolase [Caulobacteraceae bacterium]